MKVLSYKDWRYFDAVIEKAKIACQNSEITDIDHFVASNKMVERDSGAKREQKDYKLTRLKNTEMKNINGGNIIWNYGKC